MGTTIQSQCYQILKKYLKNVCVKDYTPFSITIISIYNLHFRFIQQYSKSHALININENIRKALDDGNIGYGVLVDLQKAFDTVDHKILLAKLNHDGVQMIGLDPICLIIISMYP